MRDPLQGFAERIVRCQEVEEFIAGLIETGANPEAIKKVAEQYICNPAEDAPRSCLEGSLGREGQGM